MAELETNTLTNQNNNKLYQSLAIGGTVGIVIFLMGYLVFKKKKKAL